MKRRTAILAAMAGAVALGAGLVLASSSLRWRAQLVTLKVTGKTPELTWGELREVIGRRTGLWTDRLWESQNPFLALTAPDPAAADIAAGQRVFTSGCARCHGSDGSGTASGPSLTSGGLRHGASDLALFLAIRRGIPGSTMQPSSLDPHAAWQVVSYLKFAMFNANTPVPLATPSPAAPPVPPPAASCGERVDWPSFHGVPDGQRHSAIVQIDRTNVARLQPGWKFKLPEGDSTPLEATPIVTDDRVFVSLPGGDTWALAADSGEVIWHRAGHPVPEDLAKAVEGNVSRGVAVVAHTVIVPEIDGRLVGLDAQTGRERWVTEVADYRSGYRLIAAPLQVRDAVIVGVGGADRGVRGFLDAYSASTGQRLWRFYTVDAARGGGTTAVTGTWDPELDLVFWGTGNPGPGFNGDGRPGDNRYSSSVIAVDASTGTLRWSYQVSPHDERDWGVTHVPVLADITVGEQRRKVVRIAGRNGFLYTLDRASGQFLQATAYAHQIWNAGFDPEGRPKEREGTRPSSRGTLLYPGHAGATNWASPSFDPASGLMYVITRDGYGNIIFKNPRESWKDGAYWGGEAIGIPQVSAQVRAISAATGELRWAYRFPGVVNYSSSGVLTTGGGLLFAGEKQRFVALDSTTGRELWHYETTAPMAASPVTWADARGQHVGILAGDSLLTFSLPPGACH
jgi:alcohol dehydrogenase (cytochrome c)